MLNLKSGYLMSLNAFTLQAFVFGRLTNSGKNVRVSHDYQGHEP